MVWRSYSDGERTEAEPFDGWVYFTEYRNDPELGMQIATGMNRPRTKAVEGALFEYGDFAITEEDVAQAIEDAVEWFGSEMREILS